MSVKKEQLDGYSTASKMARKESHTPCRAQSPEHAIAAAVAIGAGVGFSVSSFFLGTLFYQQLPGVVLDNRLSGPSRWLFAGFILSGTAMAAVVPLFAHFVAIRKGAADPQRLLRRVLPLRPLCALFLLPVFFHPRIWSAMPLLMFVLAGLTAALVAAYLPAGAPTAARLEGGSALWPRALTLVLVAAWVGYVAWHTILRHYSLATHAYDLGIMENVFWNSVHGNLFSSPLEPAGNHLGVHTSYLYALFFPLYALLPHTETLLVLQALVLGLAAWPLFLCARIHLGSDLKAAVVAGIYLAHPGIAGAAFFDFHELALTPLLLFSAYFFRLRQRWVPFWFAVAALLAVKEDMAIVVALLGITFLLGRRPEGGVRLVALGIICYLVNTKLVIPFFAGPGMTSFSWYYQELIPAGEGPVSLLVTILTNPVFVLRYATTAERALYILQIFSPLAFLCFLTFRGGLLVSYGLVVTVLGRFLALHQIGFQYPLLLVPLALIGLLIGLDGRPPATTARALAAAALLSLIICYHYGMIYPRHNFAAGFVTYDFDYNAQDRENRRQVLALAAQIPAQASVKASEELVPHVVRRRMVRAEGRFGADADFDYLFYRRMRMSSPTVPGYELVDETECCVLLRRKTVE